MAMSILCDKVHYFLWQSNWYSIHFDGLCSHNHYIVAFEKIEIAIDCSIGLYLLMSTCLHFDWLALASLIFCSNTPSIYTKFVMEKLHLGAEIRLLACSQETRPTISRHPSLVVFKR